MGSYLSSLLNFWGTFEIFDSLKIATLNGNQNSSSVNTIPINLDNRHTNVEARSSSGMVSLNDGIETNGVKARRVYDLFSRTIKRADER